MKKIILTMMFCSFSLLSYAGGPDQMADALSGFSLGAQGGIDENFVNTTSLYQGFNVAGDSSRGTTIHETETNFSGLYGANLSWNKWFGSNGLSFIFSFNEFMGKNTTTTQLSANATADGQTLTLNNIIEFKRQYNLGLVFKHAISNMFNVLVGTGFSTLKVHDTFYSTNSFGASTGQGATENAYLYGGYLNLGGEYVMSRHTSLDANLFYFFYKSRNLNQLNTEQVSTVGGTGDTQSLNRKIQISMPVIMFGFNYYI